MKKAAISFSLIVLFFAYSCGGGSGDKSKSESGKSGIYEPKTQEEFVNILSEMKIAPYPGAIVTGFLNNANAVITYKVGSEGNTNKAIIEYYGAEFEKAFNGKEDWRKLMSSQVSIMYMKGYDLTFGIAISSKNAAMEALGSTDPEYIPDSLSYDISLGDGAVSY